MPQYRLLPDEDEAPQRPDIQPGTPAKFENISDWDRQRIMDNYQVQDVDRPGPSGPTQYNQPQRQQFRLLPMGGEEAPARRAPPPRRRFTPEWAAQESAKDNPLSTPFKETGKEAVRLGMGIAGAMGGALAGGAAVPAAALAVGPAALALPFVGGATGSALAEALAQKIFDEEMNGRQIALQGLLGAIPGFKFAKVASPLGRMGVRAAEGGAMGLGGYAAGEAIESRTPTWEGALRSAGLGTLMGGAFGGYEGRKRGGPPTTAAPPVDEAARFERFMNVQQNQRYPRPTEYSAYPKGEGDFTQRVLDERGVAPVEPAPLKGAAYFGVDPVTGKALNRPAPRPDERLPRDISERRSGDLLPQEGDVYAAEREMADKQAAARQVQRATEGSKVMAESYLQQKGQIRPEPRESPVAYDEQGRPRGTMGGELEPIPQPDLYTPRAPGGGPEPGYEARVDKPRGLAEGQRLGLPAPGEIYHAPLPEEPPTSMRERAAAETPESRVARREAAAEMQHAPTPEQAETIARLEAQNVALRKEAAAPVTPAEVDAEWNRRIAAVEAREAQGKTPAENWAALTKRRVGEKIWNGYSQVQKTAAIARSKELEQVRLDAEAKVAPTAQQAVDQRARLSREQDAIQQKAREDRWKAAPPEARASALASIEQILKDPKASSGTKGRARVDREDIFRVQAVEAGARAELERAKASLEHRATTPEGRAKAAAERVKGRMRVEDMDANTRSIIEDAQYVLKTSTNEETLRGARQALEERGIKPEVTPAQQAKQAEIGKARAAAMAKRAPRTAEEAAREAEQTRVSEKAAAAPEPTPEPTLTPEGKVAPKTAEERARDAETLRGHQEELGMVKEAKPEPKMPMPVELKQPRQGTHLSSNVESLQEGFKQRELGISVARGRGEEQSSPTTAEPIGTKARVMVEVTGKGLDYANREHRRYIDGLFKSVGPPYDTNTIAKLREQGIAWVDNWNGIGKADELHVLDPNAIKVTGHEPYKRPKIADLPLDQPVIERRGRTAEERAASTERIRKQQAAEAEPTAETEFAERPAPTPEETAEVQRLRAQGKLEEAQGPIGEEPWAKPQEVQKAQRSPNTFDKSGFDFGPEVDAQVAARGKLRVAWKVDGKLDPEFIGQKGSTHGSDAEMTAKLIEAHKAGKEIKDGFVDDNGKWHDNLEAYLADQMPFLEQLKTGFKGTEKGAQAILPGSGRFTAEEVHAERLARESRKAVYRTIVDFATMRGRTIDEAAADMNVNESVFKRLMVEHHSDEAAEALGSLSDSIIKGNERAAILEPELGNIAATGHISYPESKTLPGEARPDLYASWGAKKPITYDYWVSQKFKDINENKLVEVGKQLAQAREALTKYAKDDTTSAQIMDEQIARFKEVQKAFNKYANEYSKISMAYARGFESRKRAPNPFPEDVAAELRRIGIETERGRKLRERIPLDTNIIHQMGRLFKEGPKALNSQEWHKVFSDLVNADRFNLFSIPSAALDIGLNASELGVQGVTGFAGDIVHVARGGRSLPNTSGIIKAIGFHRIGNWEPGVGIMPREATPGTFKNNALWELGRRESSQFSEKMDMTFAGEAMPGQLRMGELMNNPMNWWDKRALGVLPANMFQTGKQGVFTRRGNQLSAFGDTMQGVVYSKAAVDLTAKNISGYTAINREAIIAADKAGVKGLDRRRFMDNYWSNLPSGTLQTAIEEANKAGFNRPLSVFTERVARSNVTKLLFDPFLRFGAQYAKWAGEFVGINPTIWRKAAAGTLGAHELTRYLTRMAAGPLALYFIDQVYEQNDKGYVDYNSGEWVDNATKNRQRISSWEPVVGGLLVNQVIKGTASAGVGNMDAAQQHFTKAMGLARYASFPILKSIFGDTGLVGEIRQELPNVARGGSSRLLVDKVTDWANRALPGQAIMSATKSIIDPTLREGFGSRLPGVSYFTPPRVNMATGGTIEPKQRVSVPFMPEISVDLPSIGGTPAPGASRIIEPVAGLLSQYGLLEYRGPRMPVAGYRANELPSNMNNEWAKEFGKQRSLILGQLLPAVRDAERQAGGRALKPESPFYEKMRKMIQSYDAIAARHATDIVTARHPLRSKPGRQPSIRELQRQRDEDING